MKNPLSKLAFSTGSLNVIGFQQMQIRVRLCIVTCLLAVASTSAAYGLDLRPKIDPLARPLIENGIAVGFVVGIFKNSETQIIGYGETTKGSGIAPNGDTVYEVGSISKVFTGVLLAEMVQGG